MATTSGYFSLMAKKTSQYSKKKGIRGKKEKNEEEEQMATTTSKIWLKLLVDEKAKKVFFAEAGKDFVDFLFSLLEVPLGSIIGPLMKLSMSDSGSLVKIYESVQNLDPSYLHTNASNKESLLSPKPAYSSTSITPPPLLTNLLPQYGVRYDNRDDNIYYDDGSWTEAPSNEVGYVKGVVTYMVLDNLEVKPMSTISSITLLNTFNVKDVSKLHERTVEVDNQKALELMKVLLDPNRDTVLTDVFISNNTTPPVATG